MPRSAVTIAPDLSTDATFRTLCSGIKTGIEAMGWVQTSDTGQMNFATVTKPASGNAIQGYALWRSNDSLTGSFPMILKLQFGSTGSATQFRLTASFGYLTDGAGNINGLTNNWSGIQRDGPNTSTATAYDCFFSGDTNRLIIHLFENNVSSVDNDMIIAVERTHDNTGADTNFGMYAVVANGGGNNQNHRVIPFGGAPWFTGVQNQFMGFTAQVSTVLGTQVGMFPIFPFYVIGLNPSVQFQTYFTSDITAGTIVTTSLYGATMNFYCCKNIQGANNGNRVAMRWDT